MNRYPLSWPHGWRQILEVDPQETRLAVVEQAYLRLRSQAHPDKPGGNAERFAAIQRAWEQAREALQ